MVRCYGDMDDSGKLTEDEQSAGWYFCIEFDDLLVNRTWPHCRDCGYLCGYCKPDDEQEALA